MSCHPARRNRLAFLLEVGLPDADKNAAILMVTKCHQVDVNY